MESAGRLAQLTGREQDVMALIADGFTNQAIARRLGIAQTTVEKHVARVLTKLDVPPEIGVNGRVAAVVNWLRLRG